MECASHSVRAAGGYFPPGRTAPLVSFPANPSLPRFSLPLPRHIPLPLFPLITCSSRSRRSTFPFPVLPSAVVFPSFDVLSRFP
eukprot:1317752-Pyramimonas_sp.AAC.2